METSALNSAEASCRAKCHERMGSNLPAQLSALGNLDLLSLPKTALSCSVRCPGRVRRWRRVSSYRSPGFATYHHLPGTLISAAHPSGVATTRTAEKPVTAELAIRRNEFVAALADQVCFAHITPSGQAERVTHRLIDWRVPFSTLDRTLPSRRKRRSITPKTLRPSRA